MEDEEIVQRLGGRRVHPNSGRIYHIIYNPPAKEGVDDETGEALVQREDDKEDTIRNRLEIYHQQTEPLVAFYKEQSGENKPSYLRVEGVGGVDDIRDAIFAGLK